MPRRPTATAALPRDIGHVMIYVRDMRRALAFYGKTLGLPCLHSGDCWSEFRTGGATLALHLDAKARPRETGISFNVGNVDDTVGALRRRGVTIVRPPAPVSDDIRCASFADPEGNVLGVAGR